MHGGWRSIVEEQLTLMHSSGLHAKLQRLYIGLLGPDRQLFDFHDDKIEIIHYDPDFGRFEFPTIQWMHRFCQSNDGQVLYLHTKGAFNDTPCTHDWRRYMQHFLIERHEDCLKALTGSDVCGVDWLMFPWPHFSGNFWWARSQYVRTLEDPDSIPVVPLLNLGKRHCAERWIGTGKGVRAACLFRSCTNLYAERFPPSRYIASADTEAGVSAGDDVRPLDSQIEPSTASGFLATSQDRCPRVAGNRKASSPIYGFMHVAMAGHWRQIVDEQILKLKASGLWDKTEALFIGLLGPSSEPLSFEDPKLRLRYLGEDFEPAELPTLAWLQSFCLDHDGLVYYQHTKGVFRQGLGQEQWRRCMEHFVIHEHQQCIEALADHDLCGINWGDRGWCRFFGGNFWWARAQYIRTLPDIHSLTLRPGLDPAPRHVCERWIGENPAARVKCLHDTRTDHYANQPYPRSRYAKLREVQRHAALLPSAWSGLENRFQDLLEGVCPLRTIVEIGVEHGHSLFSLAAAAPSATVIGVDPYETMPSFEVKRLSRLGAWAVVGSAADDAWVRRHLDAFPNVVLLKTTGEQAAQLLGNSIDVLHLDAVHSYADLRSEFLRWVPKVRAGGCVLFHDTVSFPNDVGRLFAELPGRKAEIRDCNGLGAWYKPSEA